MKVKGQNFVFPKHLLIVRFKQPIFSTAAQQTWWRYYDEFYTTYGKDEIWILVGTTYLPLMGSFRM
jgi:hypothetical protein